MPPAPIIRVESRVMRPVAARVISYGRSSKIRGHATLYVMRVARGGSEWFVARRYSEFRALYDALRGALSRPHGSTSAPSKQRKRACPQCAELARQFGQLQFPPRFRLRSGFASAKEKIESSRLHEFNQFLRLLLETTQGLLANEDFDDDDDEEENTNQAGDWGCRDSIEAEDRCDALRLIREFLMVHEHNDEHAGKPAVRLSATQTQLAHEPSPHNEPQVTPSRATPVMTPQRPAPRPRLSSSGSVTSFRVQELDVLYRQQTSPLAMWSQAPLDANSVRGDRSPGVLAEHELDAVFLDDYASPAADAVIFRQEGDELAYANPAVHPFRRAESLRMSRRP